MKLTIALFDSAPGEMRDIFPDQPRQVAVELIINMFSFPPPAQPTNEQSTTEEPKSQLPTTQQVVSAYGAIVAWGVIEAHTASMVELLTTLTQRTFHHYIVNDQELETLFETGTHKAAGKSPAISGEFTKVAKAAINFVMKHPRDAVQTCFKNYAEEIVEGTDSIILCEAYSYSVRGFPNEQKEKLHDSKKGEYFVGIIDKVYAAAKEDIKQIFVEHIKAIKDFGTCIATQADSLNTAFATMINKAHPNLFTSKSEKPVLVEPILPLPSFEIPTGDWGKVGNGAH